MLKMSSISDLKRPTAPKILNSLSTMMQRTTNENTADLQILRKPAAFSFTVFFIIVSSAAVFGDVAQWAQCQNGCRIERKRLFTCIIVLKQRNAQAGTRVACVTRPEAVSAAGLGWGRGGYIICFQNCFQRSTMHQVTPRVIIKYATEKSGVD